MFKLGSGNQHPYMIIIWVFSYDVSERYNGRYVLLICFSQCGHRYNDLFASFLRSLVISCVSIHGHH